MKYLYAILIFVTALIVWAFADPPPLPADQSQVFSPDQLIVIYSYPEPVQPSIRLRLANGEDVQVAGTNAVISSVTGEPLTISFRETTPVPAEILAMPQYTPGAAWGMRYTSLGTNYFLCKTIASGFTKPEPPVPPRNVTMKVTFYEDLTTNAIATLEGTMDMNTGFMKTEVITE